MKNFIILFIFIFFLFSTSYAQSGPDDTGTIIYTDPDSPYPDTGSDRSDCLARSVVVEVRCYVPGYHGIKWTCGWSRAETYCNWGTPDVYCCKTQQQIDSLRQRVYARACQQAVYNGTCPHHNPSAYWCKEYNWAGWPTGDACY